MTKLAADVINLAFRRLNLKAEDQALTADEFEYGSDVLDGIFAELSTGQGLTFTWTLATIPDQLANPLANLLATEIAPSYLVQAPERRSAAMGRVRAIMAPDDRSDERDADSDGTVTTAEAAVGARAAYY